MKLHAQAIIVVGLAVAFCAWVLAGVLFSLDCLPAMLGLTAVAGAAILGTLRFSVSQRERTPAIAIDILAALHALVACILAFSAGNSWLHFGHHPAAGPLQLIVAILLTMLGWGLWHRRPWLPLALALFYVGVAATPIASLYYLLVPELRDGGGMYFAFAFHSWCYFIALPSFFVAGLVTLSIFRKGRVRIFSEKGVFYYETRSMLIWFAFAGLMLTITVKLYVICMR